MFLDSWSSAKLKRLLSFRLSKESESVNLDQGRFRSGPLEAAPRKQLGPRSKPITEIAKSWKSYCLSCQEPIFENLTSLRPKSHAGKQTPFNGVVHYTI